jgi:hypothetical protein
LLDLGSPPESEYEMTTKHHQHQRHRSHQEQTDDDLAMMLEQLEDGLYGAEIASLKETTSLDTVSLTKPTSPLVSYEDTDAFLWSPNQ